MTRGFTAATTLAGLALIGCDSGPEAPLVLPVPIAQESPFRYPESLWDEHVEGQVLLMVRVAENGAIDSVYVREGSGHAAMDSAAVAGARELRFEPGTRAGEPVPVWMRLPVRFSKAPPQDEGVRT